jgi:carboxyl-terminal processing protease
MRSVGLIVLAACGSAAAPPPAQPAPVKPVAVKEEVPPADPRVAADLKSFDLVWKRVAETFYDPKLGGVDWQAVRAELRPKVLGTKTREEARAIMNQALERLGKSHFGVSGPIEAVDEGAGEGAGDGDASIGIEVRIVDKTAIVTRIEAGSPAAKAKLPLGAELVTVGKVELGPRLGAVAEKLGASSLVPHLQVTAVERLIRGRAGTKVRLGVKVNGKVAPVELERVPAGRMTAFGNLGRHPIVYEARRLEPKIGYIRLSIFLDPAMVVPAFGKDLAGFGDATGVIIDLRGNPGGLGLMAMGMAGHLISEENKKLGTMRTREATMDYVVNPQVQRYGGKVAVLVDELSASTSEIFAGGLQDLGRARIFGRRTPGAALPSAIEELPNGDRFQYAIADYVSTGGKILEGNGVTPDVPVALDLQLLRSGKDPDMVAAIRWIKEKP